MIIDCKYKIGDLVEVSDDGRSYAHYDYMADRMSLKKWKTGMTPSIGEIGKVVACDVHPSSPQLVLYGLYIKEHDIDIIIGEGGVSTHVEPVQLPDDLFEFSHPPKSALVKGLPPEKPYITKQRIVIDRLYNPEYGDDRVCKCGHPYYRHFDSYEDMEPVGCKYCSCYTFKEEI